MSFVFSSCDLVDYGSVHENKDDPRSHTQPTRNKILPPRARCDFWGKANCLCVSGLVTNQAKFTTDTPRTQRLRRELNQEVDLDVAYRTGAKRPHSSFGEHLVSWIWSLRSRSVIVSALPQKSTSVGTSFVFISPKYFRLEPDVAFWAKPIALCFGIGYVSTLIHRRDAENAEVSQRVECSLRSRAYRPLAALPNLQISYLELYMLHILVS